MAECLLRGTPILFCALAFFLAWKGGILNIGADGQFLVGALAAAAAGTLVSLSGFFLLALMLASGAAAGMAWAGLASWLVERRGALDALATILLNFVAAGLVSIAVHTFLQESARTFPQSEAIPESARLPVVAVVAGRAIHAGPLLALLCAVAVWALLARTKFGFRVRAVGANRNAAAFAGFHVARVRTLTFLASGALAGLGGAVELAGTTGRLFEYFSPGYGYQGLAAAVVGGLSAPGCAAGAAAFGALTCAGTLLQRRYGISPAAVLVLQAALLVTALVLPRLKNFFPRRADDPAR